MVKVRSSSDPGQLVPASPWPGVRRGLPDVVQPPVTADGEDPEPPIGVAGRHDLGHPPTKPVPAAPRSGVRNSLPDAVKAVVTADGEDLQAPVRIGDGLDL